MRVLFIGLCAGLLLVACERSGADNAIETDSQSTKSDALPIFDGKDAWTIDYETSTLGFIAEQEGRSFEGKFEEFEIAVRLNPDDLANAEIHATIDMTSFDAGDAERNEYLPTKAWFNLKEFPVARFSATEIVSTGSNNNYEARGELTMKGVTMPVALPFALEISAGRAMAEGQTTLNRTNYSIGAGYTEEEVGETVRVTLNITAEKK